MEFARHDSVAHPKSRHLAANSPDDTEVAVADRPGVLLRCGRKVLSPFIVSPIGADLERRDLRFNPNLIVCQILRVELHLIDAQIPGTVQHGNLHSTYLLSVAHPDEEDELDAGCWSLTTNGEN